MITHAQPKRFPVPRLLILLIIFLLAVIIPLGVVVDKNAEHGVKAHEAEYAAINECMDRNGPDAIYQSRSWRRPNEFWRICDLGGDKWGVQLVRKVKNGWQEKTAFCPGNGSFCKVVEYVTARAIRIWTK